MKRLQRRYGRAAADPMKAFRTAAKKIEKSIAVAAAGGDINQSFSVRHLFDAINRLEDRANKAEIRGDDALREEAWAITKRLREATRAAEETGYHATQAARTQEIVNIRTRERERLENMTPSERATYNYQQELKLTRGGR